MIPRYTRKEIEKIWSTENKLFIWNKIECLVAEALSKIGTIPKKASNNIKKRIKFNLKEIAENEKETKHDFVAYINNVSKYIGKDSKYFHYGLTSSDIIDTSFSIQLKLSAEILIKDLKSLLKELKSKSIKYKNTVMIGRSHGMHAEPITFGLKLATFYSEFERNLKRLETAKKEISICAISGPVGTYNSIDPRIEKYVASKLNLRVEKISTQIIPRDRHAYFFSVISIIGSSIERLAIEIRHLQRTEILEVEEFFNSNQKGSSAMPHKRNPILSENLTGLSRFIRSSTIPFLENIAVWHERDISHSSVERILAPDITIACDFALSRLASLIKNLTVYPKNMEINLNKMQDNFKSQNILLKLINKGLTRQQAYSIVQRSAKKAWNTSSKLEEILKKDNFIKKNFSQKEYNDLFKYDVKVKHIDRIFNNVFKKAEK